MSRNSVRVCVRTRPTQHFAQNNLFVDCEHGTVAVRCAPGQDGEKPVAGPNNQKTSFQFRFDHVFHNASQAEVYDLHARDTVHGVALGTNGAIMSYGQTGSGKTFTMLGDASSYEHRGVAPRAISQLFAEISARVEVEYMVSVTFLEIYNERIYDLLADPARNEGTGNGPAEYTIVEEKDGRGIIVRGLTELEVRDEASALNCLFTGGLSRTMATHRLNKRSNRSHSVFTLHVQQRQRSGVSEKIGHSKLHLIDLAGSERLKKTMDGPDGTLAADEVTRRESMAINRSLSYLEQCIVALAARRPGVGTGHIPYRQSKLTNVLKDCLGANCNTVMIACIWGEKAHLEETISTLRLAARMMKVENETSEVHSVDPVVLVKRQERMIAALKQELLMHDALVERTGMVYDPYTPEQEAAVGQMIERYVSAEERDEEKELEFTTVRQMIEICKQFKRKLLDARKAAMNAALEQQNTLTFGGLASGGRLASDAPGTAADSKRGYTDGYGGLDFKSAPVVGQTTTIGRAFALGETAPEAAPPLGVEFGSSFFSSPARNNGGNVTNSAGQSMGSPVRGGETEMSFMFGTGGAALSVREKRSLELFLKSSPEGQSLYSSAADARANLKPLRQQVREASQQVNQSKSEIDHVTAELDQRRSTVKMPPLGKGAKAATTDIVDEEEMSYVRQLKEAKLRYRTHFEALQTAQNNLSRASNEANHLKQRLYECYGAWQAANGLGGLSLSMRQPAYEDSYMPGSPGAGPAGSDELDDQEAFDHMERDRVMASDPDSLAYFSAQKTRRANLNQTGNVIRVVQKQKRG